MDELVSIITPCYNGEKYIVNFLDSVLQQTYPNIELIFVDDGSTDKTKEIANSYKKPFEERGFSCHYIYQENAGQAAAINQGLKIFQGKYLIWFDSDDMMLPDSVRDKVEFLRNNLDCGFVMGKGVYAKPDHPDSAYGSLQRIPPENGDNLFEDLIREHNIIFCPGGIMVRREAILRAIPANKIYESREGQNYQLLLPLAYHYKCGYLDKVVYKCVVHDDSHSRMKRSYHEWITRYENSEILLFKTLDNIPDMPETEKEKWKNLVSQKYTYMKLVKSYKYFRIKEGRALRKELENGGDPEYRAEDLLTYGIKALRVRSAKWLSAHCGKVEGKRNGKYAL